MRQKCDRLSVRLCTALLLVFITGTLFAQKKVSGTVTAAKTSQPVSFATITVKGTNVATATDVAGAFTITVPAGKTVLTVTSVGFANQDVTIGSGPVNVILQETTSTLDEIVVTGYTAQKKKEITGAVSVVNVKDMKQMPVGTGEEALQGRASGLTIITSGQPGAASEIRIRGITTFNNNNPLIIVDGVRGDLHNINSADIESVQVLKDASAAIYGVAGANGVIIVTTKKGKSGKAVVSYDGYYGTVTKGPGYDMANPTQEANAIWQAKINSGVKFGDPSWGSKQYGTGITPVLPVYITPTGSATPGTAPYDINTNQITMANQAGTNWYKTITRNAASQSHNLSVSSGSEKSSYFFSFNYLDQQGIADYQFLRRYAVRANTVFNIKDHIRIGENAYIFYKTNPTVGNQGEGSPFSMVFREDEIIPVYDIKGNFAGTKSQDLGNAQNPYANAYRTKDNRNNTWDITGNVFAEADFLKHFTVRTQFGGVIDNGYTYNFNYVAYENAEGNTGTNSFSEGAYYNSSWTYTNTLTYGNTFGKHNIKALIGTEAVSYYGRNVGATRSNYFSQDPNYWVIGAGTGTQSNSGGAYQSTFWSQFAKVEYAYAGKYLLNGTLRRDQASVFDPAYNTGYFPGVSAAWRISQESFLKKVSFINDLKIRGSWGKLGTSGDVNATNPLNLYGTRAGKSAYDIFGNSTTPYAGFYRSNIGNVSTTWEGDIITNVGLDATLLNNKLDVTVEWFKKKISGLFYNATGAQYDPIVVGDASLPQVNRADNQNTGLELNATYHGTISRDFKFDIGANITSYKNKIVYLPGADYFDGYTIRNAIINRFQVGHPFGAFFGYKVDGLFKDAADVAKSPTQADAQPGVFKYHDVNGDGKIDANDRTWIGDPNPNFTYGINISFSYKNFDFAAFFFGSQGGEIYNFTKYYTDFPDFFKGAIRRDAALNAWTPTNTNASIPLLRTTGGFSTDQATSSYFVSSGSYLRCKQMQIGYNLPAKMLAKAGVDRLRIYVQAANLFTITGYKGLDPELQSSDLGNTRQFGIDQGNYPHTPAYLVGVNLNF